jgi:3-oxoacyl-[acyl-carrier protein] reductase
MSEREKVLISGASRGIGRAIALDLARDHEVVTFARGLVTESLDHPLHDRVSHIPGIDVRTIEEAASLEAHLESSDVLINNVGVAFDGIFATQSYESIRETVDVNLVSVLLLTKSYVRSRLAVRKAGCVLNVSSIVGSRGFSGLVAYGASKAGIDGMTRALAREMGGRGFRVNSLVPGFVETEMSSSMSDDARQQVVRRTPLGRLARPEDVVPVARFLISRDAAFVTGQSIVVDGGATV